MDITRLRDSEHEAIAHAAAVLQKGGTVLYPTDTLYGLGADAFSDEAVAKIYDIKGREERKPIHALVSGIAMAERFGELDDLARQLLSGLPAGQLTLIVPKKKGIDSGIAKGLKTFGFRIPENSFCQSLLREFGAPITATSANKSGETPPRSVEDILAQLGPSAQRIDLVIDARVLPLRQPSTVVDLSRKEPVILREGAIGTAEVWSAVRAEY